MCLRKITFYSLYKLAVIFKCVFISIINFAIGCGKKIVFRFFICLFMQKVLAKMENSHTGPFSELKLIQNFREVNNINVTTCCI